MKKEIINTREKDRQSQVLCVFALVDVLMLGWQTIPELKSRLASLGFPRCEKTVRRLFRTLKAASVDLLADRSSQPHRFRVRKARMFVGRKSRPVVKKGAWS